MIRDAPRLTVDFGYLRKADGTIDSDELEQVKAVFECGSFRMAAAKTGADRRTIAASWRRFRAQVRRQLPGL